MAIDNYFCSHKFDWIQIRLYDGYVASCCQASPYRVRKSDIIEKPMGFFNFDHIQQDRKAMLANQRLPGCEGCWQQEEQGVISFRQKTAKTDNTGYSIFSVPKHVSLDISNTCNQTCVYCCKNFSHSWLADIEKNGDYNLPGDTVRYQMTDSDRVLVRLSQKDLHASSFQQLIFDQLSNNVEPTSYTISGGEPFLDNNLCDLVSRLTNATDIRIFTGMNVNPARFQKICRDLKDLALPIRLVLSAENLHHLHEFNRYGSSYQQWLTNYASVQKYFEYEFNSVITNLTVIGFADFHRQHMDERISVILSVDPAHLHANLLDDKTKDMCLQSLAELPQTDHINNIIKMLQTSPDLQQKPVLKKFLDQFSSRRNLSLDCFPRSFIQWLELD